MNRNQLFLCTVFAILLGMVIEITFFMREAKAQTPIIVLDPDGNVKSIVIMPLPPPLR